jgi:hypothetical protein
VFEPRRGRHSGRGTVARKLLLMIAVLATLVVLGCWDNRRQIQRVLDEGHATTAQISGAQYQRALPIAADGWRPRFIEQELSVDLGWQGKDGKAHTYRKVPVSERFARSIVNGDQIRLATVPVKALDDESAPPVITPDAGARLESLQGWMTVAGYTALATWAGFAALTLMQAGGGAGRAGRMPGRPAVELPPRRTIIGLIMLVVGGFLAFTAWSQGRAGDSATLGGQEATADIVNAVAVPGKDGGKPTYRLQLSWKDVAGIVHRVGPVPVSEAYWNKITRDGALTVKQTAIRYRDSDSIPRPVIVDDAPEQHWQTQLAMGGGLVLMVLGLACLFSAMRRLRN